MNKRKQNDIIKKMRADQKARQEQRKTAAPTPAPQTPVIVEDQHFGNMTVRANDGHVLLGRYDITNSLISQGYVPAANNGVTIAPILNQMRLSLIAIKGQKGAYAVVDRRLPDIRQALIAAGMATAPVLKPA